MFNIKTRAIALAATAAVAATGVVGGAATAEAAGPAKTKLTIQTQNGDFSGLVKSKKPRRCVGDREITVYRQVGATKNRSVDEEVAMDTSARQGRVGKWETGNTGLRDGKRYYAYTPAIPGCKRAFSRTVRTVLDPESVEN